jgi:hypothetical protein
VLQDDTDVHVTVRDNGSGIPEELVDAVFEPGVSTKGDARTPGLLLRFFDAGGREVTRTTHTAPPVLDGDGDTVRAWLSGGATR